jgi:hypothetical protein
MKPFGYKTKLAIAQRRLAALLDYESWIKGRGTAHGAAGYICRKYRMSYSTLIDCRARVVGLSRHDWLYALFPGWARKGGAKVEIKVACWDVFIASYFGQDGHCASRSYRLIKRLAPVRGWHVPCFNTFLRRLHDEFPQQPLLRSVPRCKKIFRRMNP